MIVEGKGRNRLDFFQDLYADAKSQSEQNESDLEKWMEQYKGSKVIDNSDTEATAVRNITYELIESQVTSYIPSPKVEPRMESDMNIRRAKAIESMLKQQRNRQPFEKMNDMDERYSPIYGGSIWLVEWDDSITSHETVGDIKCTCIAPTHFVGQPNIYSIEDMEYCFIEFETTKEDIVRKYGVSVEIADEAESEDSADDKTATLIVCYYKNDDDKVCQYIWSGDTEILNVDNYFQRKREYCKKCGKRKEICTCENPSFVYQDEEEEELERDVPLSDGTVLPAMSPVFKDGMPVMETEKQQAHEQNGMPAFQQINGSLVPLMVDVQIPKMEQTKIPFYTPSVFPIVIRKNTSEEDNLLGQSDCSYIRPEQQQINKLESRIQEKLMSSGVYPMVPEDFHGDLDNSVFKTVFRVKPNQVSQFGRVDLQVDISRDIQQSERLYEHAKRILGITDSYRGINESAAQSGVAKQVMVQQAAGRLESKRQMKNACYADMDRIMFQYYLAYADEPRPAVYRDAQGRLQNSVFNRYDFVERDENGEYYYNDEFLFACDTSADIESNRETIWQENRANFQQGAYGDPAMPQTQLIFWQNMEKAHYPWAQDNVERIQAEIERQAEMAMLQQQNAQLQNEITTRKDYETYLKGGQNNG